MLMRDFGFQIYKCIVCAPTRKEEDKKKDEKKEKEEKKEEKDKRDEKEKKDEKDGRDSKKNNKDKHDVRLHLFVLILKCYVDKH